MGDDQAVRSIAEWIHRVRVSTDDSGICRRDSNDYAGGPSLADLELAEESWLLARERARRGLGFDPA